jgi:hypothetical protein
MDRLSEDFLREHVFPFVGDHQYRFVAAVSSDFRRIYLDTFPSKTTLYDALSTVAQADLCYDEGSYKVRGGWCIAAAKNGRLPVLQFLHGRGSPLNQQLCAVAASGGHLAVLKWLHVNGCPWDEYTFSSASEHGHFEVLRWLRENNCPWCEQTCSLAASGGHFGILKWLHANECPWDEYTFAYAASRGDLKNVKLAT